MELNVEINAEAINREISDAIAKSAIGQELERVIGDQVKKLSVSYNNPIEGVIKRHIADCIAEVIRDNYSETIKEEIKKLISEEFVSDLFDRLWKSFRNQY